jgi:hypothetical protein
MIAQTRQDGVGTTKIYLYICGDIAVQGNYDESGNFVPDPKLGFIRKKEYGGKFENALPRGGSRGDVRVMKAIINKGNDLTSYEHRAGALIQGVLVSTRDGEFVPDVGEKIRAMAEYDRNDPALPIYNMPDVSSRYWTFERTKAREDGSLKRAEPPDCGEPNGMKLEYQEKMYGMKYCYVYKEMMMFGMLNRSGQFVPDDELPVLTRGRFLSAAPFTFNLPHPPDPRQKTEEVYEFRSGRLIKGRLDETGNFTPEIGSVVKAFRDFDPAKERMRIYNLPGRLVKKS